MCNLAIVQGRARRVVIDPKLQIVILRELASRVELQERSSRSFWPVPRKNSALTWAQCVAGDTDAVKTASLGEMSR